MCILYKEGNNELIGKDCPTEIAVIRSSFTRHINALEINPDDTTKGGDMAIVATVVTIELMEFRIGLQLAQAERATLIDEDVVSFGESGALIQRTISKLYKVQQELALSKKKYLDALHSTTDAKIKTLSNAGASWGDLRAQAAKIKEDNKK